MRRFLASVIALTALMMPAHRVLAQGFGVFEHSSCAMARGGTGVAATCDDGSAAFFNPAGLTTIRGLTISVGVTLIDALGGFTDDLTGTTTDLDNDPIPVPQFYIATGLSDKVSVGLGVFVPFGLGTKWPTTFEGRFNGYDNDLQSVYIQPTVAYKVSDRLSIGAGLDFVIGSVELNQRVDLSENAVPGAGISFGNLGVPFHTDFGNARLKATGATGIGANFGATLQLTDNLSLGARYLLKVDLDYDGDVTFTQIPTGLTLAAGNPLGAPPGTPIDALLTAAFAAGGPLSNQTAKTAITMPDQLVAGLAYRASSSLLLLADYQFTRWSKFDALRLDFSNAATPDRLIREDYEDSHGVRVGFEYGHSDGVKFRGGYLYHTAAAPDQTVTPLLPEGARNEFTVGFGFHLTSSLEANVAYQYIRQNDRRGRVRDPFGANLPTTDLNSGLYDFKAHLFGLTLTLKP